MSNIRRLCVYCGSSGAVAQEYREAATDLGARLAAAGIGLVYGGGRVGRKSGRCRGKPKLSSSEVGLSPRPAVLILLPEKSQSAPLSAYEARSGWQRSKWPSSTATRWLGSCGAS